MTSSDEEDINLIVKEELCEESLQWNAQMSGSAFSPYKPVTTLTNLQRGNVESQTVQVFPEEFTLYSKAAMGEMLPEDCTAALNVNEKDEHGFTYAMWASFYGQFPTVRLLIKKHSDLDVQGNNGETAMLLAACGGHHEIIGLCLASGSDPDHQDHYGNTALMYAANCDHAHCVSELMENGASLSLTNFNNISAYSLAVSKGSKRAQIVMERYLLRMLEPS